MLQKLGVDNRTQAVIMLSRIGTDPLSGQLTLPRYSAAAGAMRRTRVISARSTAGFTGLLTTVTSSFGSGAHLVRAVGGDENRGHALAPSVAQLADHVEAGFAVEMVVGEDEVGRRSACCITIAGNWCGLDAAAPAFDQQPHAFKDAGVIVDAEHREPAERGGGRQRRPGLGGSAGSAAVRHRQDDGKARALATARIDLHFQPQHARDAVDDRQAEAQPLSFAHAVVEAGELVEDGVQLVGRNADAGVEHLDFGKLAAPPHADQDPAAGACI